MNFLDRNEFNFQASNEVIETIKNFDLQKFGFYTRIYDEGKKSIFSVYLSELYNIPENQILLGYGAEHILKNAVHYFLSEDDGNKKMLIPKFSWWYYQSIASEVRGTTVIYPLYETQNSFEYNVEELLQITQKECPKILLLASPNNPTGNQLDQNQIEYILQNVPKQTIVLIDEAYASFVSNDANYIKNMIEKYDNVIFSRTMSKFYGLPGLRLGFSFIGKGERMQLLAKYSNMYLGYDRLSEEVGIAALKSDSHYRKIAKIMQDAIQMYKKEIGALEGFKVYDSNANFILIKYPICLKEKLMQAFKDQDYKIKFMNEPDINTHLRITIGREEQNRLVCDTIIKIAKQN